MSDFEKSLVLSLGDRGNTKGVDQVRYKARSAGHCDTARDRRSGLSQGLGRLWRIVKS